MGKKTHWCCISSVPRNVIYCYLCFVVTWAAILVLIYQKTQKNKNATRWWSQKWQSKCPHSNVNQINFIENEFSMPEWSEFFSESFFIYHFMEHRAWSMPRVGVARGRNEKKRLMWQSIYSRRRWEPLCQSPKFTLENMYVYTLESLNIYGSGCDCLRLLC